VNYKINERPRSPMVMVEYVSSLSLLLLLFGQVLELMGRYRWWRVIMDEVQLHSDQTDAAYVVPPAGRGGR
jgi:E3 ubiquitin-protein ligase SHPRH